MNIGIDLGGSHISTGLINKEGRILSRKDSYISKNDRKFIRKFLENSIIRHIDEILKENNLRQRDIGHIGIGVPGNIKNTTIIEAINLGIKNFNIGEKIRKHYNIPVILLNDAKCAAIAEKRIGSLKEYKNCVFLCFGTGIGGAVFFDNKLLRPIHSPGFEFGHMIIQKNGIKCNCGSRGCFERYCSMRSLKGNLKRAINTRKDIRREEVIEILNKRESNAKVDNIIEEYIDNLSIGISNIIKIFEPEAICFGGSFANYANIILPLLRERLKERVNVLNKGNRIKFVPAKLRNTAGIIGAGLEQNINFIRNGKKQYNN